MKMTPQDWQTILNRLRDNDPSLMTLSLVSEQIGDSGTEALAEVLKKNDTLISLDLGHNAISHVGAKALAVMLKYNRKLAILRFNSDPISDEGAEALAAGVRDNHTLMELDLAFSQIGVKGVQALGKMLGSRTMLTRLILWGNPFGDVGAKALAAGLIHNHMLVSLYVGVNNFSASVEEAFITMLKDNHTLLELKSTEWKLGQIDEFLKRNQSLKEQLHQACQDGDLPLVKSLLQQGVCVLSTLKTPWNSKKKGNTPLHGAVIHEQAEVVGYLIELMTKQSIPLTTPNAAGKTAEQLATGTPLASLFAPSSAYNSTTAQASTSANTVVSTSKKTTPVTTTALANQNEQDFPEWHELLTRLRNNDPTLTTVNCSDFDEFSTADIKVLATALKGNHIFMSLRLDGFQINDEATQVLAEALKTSRNLISLNLNKNKIGDSGASALATILKTTCPLAFLDLRENQIGVAGVQALTLALARKPHFISLDLRGNQIGDLGASALIELLEINHSILFIDVWYNQISELQRKQINDFLKRNESLRDQLHKAVHEGDLPQVKSLLQRGVSLLSITSRTGKNDYKDNTPLHWAVLDNQEDIARHLIKVMREESIPLTFPNGKGHTAEQLAAGTPLASLFATSSPAKSTTTTQFTATSSNSASSIPNKAKPLSTPENLPAAPISTPLVPSGNQKDLEWQALLTRIRNNDPSLTTLDLGDDQIGDAAVQALAAALKDNRTVTVLCLGSNSIGAAGAQALAAMLNDNRTVTELYLGYNQIGAAGAYALAAVLKDNRTLKTLSLRGNQIGAAGAQPLAAVLKDNRTLTTLDLSVNSIGAAQEKEIENFINLNKSLRDDLHQGVQQGKLPQVKSLLQQGVSLLSTTGELENQDNTPLHWAVIKGQEKIARYLIQEMRDQLIPLTIPNATGKTAEQLAAGTPLASLFTTPSSFTSNTTTQTTSASSSTSGTPNKNNPISSPEKPSVASISTPTVTSDSQKDLEWQALLTRIRNNDPTLTELNLGMGSIDDTDAQTLATVLKDNRTIGSLYLSNNQIGAEGARALATLLKHNRTLRVLLLTNNQIGDNGAPLLALGLKNNDTLAELNLSNNGISEFGAQSLVAALKDNVSLIKLGLEMNKISDQVKKQLTDIIERNRSRYFRDKLYTAIQQGDLSQVKSLVQQEASLVSTLGDSGDNGNNGNTPLHWAVINGQGKIVGDKIVRYLIKKMREQSIPLTTLNADGKTAEQLAHGTPLASLFAIPSSVKSTTTTQITSATTTTSNNSTSSSSNKAKAVSTQANLPVAPIPTPLVSSDSPNDLEWQVVLTRLRNNDPSLTVLDLSSKHISDLDMQALAAVLKNNRTVTELYLDHLMNHSIGDDGIHALAEALKTSRTLSKLSLGKISDVGLQSIVTALKHNHTISILYFSCYQISDVSLQAYTEMLKYNHTLTAVVGLGSNINGAAETQIYDLMKRNISFRDQLRKAVQQGDLKEVKSLLQQGVSLLFTAGIGGKESTPLLAWAVISRQIEVARYLIQVMREQSISLDLQTFEGKTAEQLAAGTPLASLFAPVALAASTTHITPKNNTTAPATTATPKATAATTTTSSTSTNSEPKKTMVSPDKIPALIKKEEKPAAVNPKNDLQSNSKTNTPEKPTVAPIAPPVITSMTSENKANLTSTTTTAVPKTQTTTVTATSSSSSSSGSTTTSTSTTDPLSQPFPTKPVVKPTLTLKTIPWEELKLGKLEGEGGYGDVHKATWHGTPVAVKRLHLKKMTVDTQVAFDKETQIMAQCDFPHVIRLLGITQEGERLGLVMEYMPRGSLYSVLHNSKDSFNWMPTRWNVALDIGRGLSYLHAIHIIHRDLKSHNVLLDENYRAKISDFGLAKVKTETKTSSASKNIATGSTRWKAPELFKQKATYGKETDVYSYGMVLCEIATREMPYGDDSDEDNVKDWIKNGDKPELPDTAPDGYKQVIQQCSATDPAKRPTAAQAVEALETEFVALPEPAPAVTKMIAEKSWHFDVDKQNLQVDPNKRYLLVPGGPKDCQKVVEFYSHHPVPGMDIKSVTVIFNPGMSRTFEGQLEMLQERHNSTAFEPQWQTETNSTWRKEVHALSEAMAKPYQDIALPHIKLLPLWHGTKADALPSIFTAGYANLAKIDKGFFGKGLYSAHEAEYSYRVYYNGALILNWVGFFSAYPTIDGDKMKLEGGANYQNYDAHFVPVVPKDPNDPNEVFYYPTKPKQKHTYTEVVVFQAAQCLPRYLVELQPALPKALNLGTNLQAFFSPKKAAKMATQQFKAIDLIDAANYVYQHFLSKPYTLKTSSTGEDWSRSDWAYTHKGVTVHRPNHGLAHTLRTLYFAPYVIAAFLEQNSNKLSASECKEIETQTTAIQLALLFFVAGRENEMGSQDDLVAYKRFRKNSADAFEKYVKAKQLPLFDQLTIDTYKDAIMAPEFKKSPLHLIIRVCHDIDTLRCLEPDICRMVMAAMHPYLGEDHCKQLAELVEACLISTGDRIRGTDNPRTYDTALFIESSTDVQKCRANIEKGIANWEAVHPKLGHS